MKIDKDVKFDLRDIALIPSVESPINSRSECKTRYDNGFLPLMASPMDTVVCKKNYKVFIDNGIIPLVPRGTDVNESTLNFNFFKSYGLSEIESLLQIKDKDVFKDSTQVLIDMANGNMSRLVEVVRDLKTKYPYVTLMVGNVGNPLTYKNLAIAGADVIRCAIGTGAGCHIENTQVLTDSGYKNIQDINIGDFVLTHKKEYKEVINKISFIEEDSLIEINGKNTCTSDHNYYVLNKKYTDIVTDDNIEEYAEWIESSKLTKEYWLLENN